MSESSYPEFTCATHRPTQIYRTTYRRESHGVELTPIVMLILAGAFSLCFVLTTLVMKVAS